MKKLNYKHMALRNWKQSIKNGILHVPLEAIARFPQLERFLQQQGYIRTQGGYITTVSRVYDT
jgi:hypothetical protein